MKMERYGVNFRKTALRPKKNRENLQIQRSPEGLKQGWNNTAYEKLYKSPQINKTYICKIIFCYMNIIIKMYMNHNIAYKDKQMTIIPYKEQAYETWWGLPS